MEKPKVLVVDDEVYIRESYKEDIAGFALVIEAGTHAQALEQLKENPDIKIIVMDGCLGGSFDTESLVMEMRKSFTGHMIAASSSRAYCRRLVAAGCNLSIDGGIKTLEVPKLILVILNEK